MDEDEDEDFGEEIDIARVTVTLIPLLAKSLGKLCTVLLLRHLAKKLLKA